MKFYRITYPEVRRLTTEDQKQMLNAIVFDVKSTQKHITFNTEAEYREWQRRNNKT